MKALKDERQRILSLVERGQVSAVEAEQLLDALESEQPQRPAEIGRERILRIRFTNPSQRAQKVNISATIPVSLLQLSLRLGARLIPQLSNNALEDLLHTIEHSSVGRVLDVQDLEKGERIEVFVE
ncbi:MAG: hypothetical protein JO202_08285 [Ktedonobacteraceae bacterium]|nr:hypothetical protein [Ktedonobacteraceae bacterium]